MHIVIIGAGILGASAAFHLAWAGADVTIIDARLDGRATAAGAGIICPWVSGVEDEAFYRLYAAGGEYYPELLAALAGVGETEFGYRRAGALLVSDDAEELAWQARAARGRHVPAMGAIAVLSPREARMRFPPLRPGLGGVHIEGGARVDGRLLAAALLRAAQAHGARLIEGDEARPAIERGRAVGAELGTRETGVSARSASVASASVASARDPSASERNARKWDGSERGAGDLAAGEPRGERIAADWTIVTAGAWAGRLGPGPAIEPQRGQIVHLRLEGQETRDWPVILPPGSHYIVPFDDGRIVAGATRESGAGFDYRVTAGGQAEVLAEALSVAPGLSAATMIETRVGFRPVGAALRPSLGRVPGIEGLVIGNGLGAAGLTIGPLAGRLLADLVTGAAGRLDLAAFAPDCRAGGPPGRLAVLR